MGLFYRMRVGVRTCGSPRHAWGVRVRVRVRDVWFASWGFMKGCGCIRVFYIPDYMNDIISFVCSESNRINLSMNQSKTNKYTCTVNEVDVILVHGSMYYQVSK